VLVRVAVEDVAVGDDDAMCSKFHERTLFALRAAAARAFTRKRHARLCAVFFHAPMQRRARRITRLSHRRTSNMRSVTTSERDRSCKKTCARIAGAPSMRSTRISWRTPSMRPCSGRRSNARSPTFFSRPGGPSTRVFG
jgi:hypothetical protein